MAAGPQGVLFAGVHPVRRFAALVGECSAVLTGDSLGMHLALALCVLTVILFGPTPLQEIETYGRAAKLSPDMECLGCYLKDCEVTPKCMERIPVGEVYEAILDVLEE